MEWASAEWVSAREGRLTLKAGSALVEIRQLEKQDGLFQGQVTYATRWRGAETGLRFREHMRIVARGGIR